MTTGRPYREPDSEEDAVAELKRCAGTQFDPRVVEEFLRLLVDRSAAPEPAADAAPPRATAGGQNGSLVSGGRKP
jgi:HD-GYP domain-containing protein (c-di-GMP phosphodiesterase class II)